MTRRFNDVKQDGEHPGMHLRDPLSASEAP